MDEIDRALLKRLLRIIDRLRDQGAVNVEEADDLRDQAIKACAS